jgi:hypothetical protein
VTRAAVLRNAAISAGIGQYAAIQSVAPSLGVELTPMNVHDASEIERAITEFSRTPNAGLIVTGSALVATHRDLVVTLAQRHRVPADKVVLSELSSRRRLGSARTAEHGTPSFRGGHRGGVLICSQPAHWSNARALNLFRERDKAQIRSSEQIIGLLHRSEDASP